MKNKSKYLGNEELYVNKVLNSEKWSSTEGSWTGRLEKEFANKFESKHGEIKMPTQGEGFSSFGVKPPKETLPN